MGACRGGQRQIADLMIAKGASNWNAGLDSACRAPLGPTSGPSHHFASKAAYAAVLSGLFFSKKRHTPLRGQGRRLDLERDSGLNDI